MSNLLHLVSKLSKVQIYYTVSKVQIYYTVSKVSIVIHIGKLFQPSLLFVFHAMGTLKGTPHI